MIEKIESEGTISMAKELSDELNQIAGTDKNAVVSFESHPDLMRRLLADVAEKLKVD